MASQSSLYKWKRQEKPHVFASRGNVQEWVKQVQKASDDAARDIFGDQPQALLGRRDVFVDDAAIMEAQDLLDSWIQKKNVDDLLAECDLGEEKWSGIEPKYPQHNTVNGFEQFSLGEDGSIHCDPLGNYYQDIDPETSKPAFELNDDFDEEYAFQEVVHNMLEKDIIDAGSVNQDIPQTKTKNFKDPTPKMELRHKQVKEKAKERKVAWEKAHLKKMTRKMVEQEARKQLQREEKEHQNKTKREEEDIRREMVKIRKALQEENTLRTKQRSREKENEENANKLAKHEVVKQQKQKEKKLKREYESKEEMKRMLLKQLEEDEARKEQESLKLLHKCFSSWYAIIVNKRVKIGKARALSDWRHKLRTWNAWKTYIRRSRSDREAKALTEEMKERHRKEALADRFYRQLIFQRCLTAWVSWVWKEKQERKQKEKHRERANKMATLLKAASSGQLWQKRSEEETTGCIGGHDVDHSHADEVEEIFLQPFKLEAKYENAKDNRNSAAPSGNNQRTGNESGNVPRQAWPHEILRDMKKKKLTRKPQPVAETANSEARRVRTSPRSTPRTEEHARPYKDTREVEAVNCRVQPQSVLLKNTGNKRDKSIATELNINTVTSEGDRLPSANTKELYLAGGGKETLQSTRSAASSISKQSKATSGKPPTKPLHLAMEERANARAERKAFLETKKREAEEEKLAKLKQEQERKEMEILAEKQASLQQKREETKLAKQMYRRRHNVRELDKQQRLEEIKELNRKADDHYRRILVRKYGLIPWKKFVETIAEAMRHAEGFYKNRLLGVCIRQWSTHTKAECQLRNDLAISLYQKILLRRGLQSWKKYRHHLVEMDQVAVQFSRRYLVRKYVRIWKDYVIEERLLYWDKENRADEHNDSRLKLMVMTYWKRYIPLLREEERREKRRDDLRKHVQSLLPDFRGIKLNESP